MKQDRTAILALNVRLEREIEANMHPGQLEKLVSDFSTSYSF